MSICFLTPELYSISLCLRRKYIFLFRARKAGSRHKRIILLSHHLSRHMDGVWVSVCAFLLLFPCLFGFCRRLLPRGPHWDTAASSSTPGVMTSRAKEEVSFRQMLYFQSMGLVEEVALGPRQGLMSWVSHSLLPWLYSTAPMNIIHQCLWEGDHVR